MQLYQVITLLAGAGLVGIYLKIRMQQREIREANERLFESRRAEAKIIEEQIKQLEESVIQKKADYEKDVIKFRDFTNKSKPTGDDDDSKG